MCGIVGAIAQREVSSILLEGLKRLEYRGYDSAGIAICDSSSKLHTLRRVGKVAELAAALQNNPLSGSLGIAHTRWATHGIPSEDNAHPQISNKRNIAVVHNGIIENYADIKSNLQSNGYIFASDTDTEVIAHLLVDNLAKDADLLSAVQKTISCLEGAYALAIISAAHPQTLIAARKGSPLILGLGLGENFVASDVLALRQVTDRFIYLEDGDIAVLNCEQINIYDATGVKVNREVIQSNVGLETADKGEYRHFMHKEIHEQPLAIQNTLEGAISNDDIDIAAFGYQAAGILPKVENIQIVACGTSFHAGSVARYWLESLAQIPCQVEVASEFRYRKIAQRDNTLLVTLSQSGETADTLTALRISKRLNFLASLTICNSAQSSMVRESDMRIEVGVASTKAFTTQLVALFLFTLTLAKIRGTLSSEEISNKIKALKLLPSKIYEILTLEGVVEKVAEDFAEKQHSLFLGRGTLYPVALEGALKLKEISYIHAEGYPAGELKHGPLALVDADMPVVVVAPNNKLLSKLKANLQEVRARGGQLLVFADYRADLQNNDNVKVVTVPEIESFLAPILYSVPLQLLAYYVAVLKGTDVDQPRNLAKSVTVE